MKTVRLTIEAATLARQGMGQLDAAKVDGTGDAEIAVHVAQDDALAMQDDRAFASRNGHLAFMLESRGLRGDWTS